MFGAPFSQKTRACFVRRCDATHLAAPKQKASAMKLLVAAENAPEDKPSNCSFGVGFKYRHEPATSRHSIITYHFLVLQQQIYEADGERACLLWTDAEIFLS